MNHQQIAKIYDNMTPEEQDMPREQFIKRMSDAIDPNKIMQEVNRMAQGRIQKAQIDAALGRGRG